MPLGRILTLVLARGIVLLLSGVAFSQQPVFGPAVNMGPKINSASHEIDPFLTADGKKLFFVSLRDNSIDIWFAELSDTGWTNPVKLPSHINAGASGKWSPSVSPDGQKLYYVDDSRLGYYWDIWVCTWDSSANDWGTPVNIGPPVNTPGAEVAARIGPDGRHLYFYSNGFGRCGIYASEWNGASWSVPSPIPPAPNCVDEYPSITADGRWFYFDKYVGGAQKSIFVSENTGFGWSPVFDLSSQIGDSSLTPFVVPSGDSLFFGSTKGAGSLGGADIWITQRFKLGDLNLDGQHSIADVVLLLNKVFQNLPYPAPEEFGDMNCDSRFSPADLVLLLNTVFLWSPFFCSG